MNKYDNLKPYKPGQSGNPKGRPLSASHELARILGNDRAKKIKKKGAAWYKEWNAILAGELTKAELLQLIAAEDVKAYPLSVAIAILKDMEAGRVNTVKAIADQVITEEERQQSGESLTFLDLLKITGTVDDMPPLDKKRVNV